MLRKIAAFVIVICLIFVSGCATNTSTPESKWSTDPSGNRVSTDTGSVTVYPKSLPISVQYNNSDYFVESVDLYQSLSTEYYSYSLFVVVTLDVSSLDDAQIHWLRESDIDVDMYLTNEKNDYDFSAMSYLGNLLITDQKKIQYVYTSSFFKDNRYSFEESEITLSIWTTQEETYEYTNSDGERTDLNKTYRIHYSFAVPNELPSPETIEEPLYGYVAQWLGEKSSFYGSLYE